MKVTGTNAGASSIAVEGVATGPNSVGVSGKGEGGGVVGKSPGWGVNGESGPGVGVRGVSNTGWGVDGESGPGIGVRGVSITGWGVDGESDAGFGVRGVSKTGFGVTGESGPSIGVRGLSKTGFGVNGESGPGVGVRGVSDTGWGVDGESGSGVGVRGICRTGWGVTGESEFGIGVHAKGGSLAGFFEGDVLVTGDISLANGDCAEDFDVCSAGKVEPGTVMVLGHEGGLFESQQAYDKRVAGVISGAGDYKPGIVLDRRQSQGNRQPVALLGKVFCKVDAQFGAIEVGDLLTTSPTPGHAMKTSDPFKAFGAVIGKALRPLTAGQGLIPILIALQ